MNRDRPLFLRWTIVTALAVSLLAALLAGGFASGVRGAPLAVSATVVVLAAVLNGYAGVLAWRADTFANDPLIHFPAGGVRRSRIVYDAGHVFYAVAVFQVLGLVGAMLGYRQETQSTQLPDQAEAVHRLTLGLGNGLTATLVGVICSLVLWLQHHLLTHSLERPA